MGKHRGVYTLSGAADALRRLGYGLLADELIAMRPLLDQHERAATGLAAVYAALDTNRPGWVKAVGGTLCDDAVAAIRSMAAQCSAQELQTLQAQLTPPAGVPPLRQAQIGALSYAIGYLEARDRGAVAVELSTLHAWLVANAPRT